MFGNPSFARLHQLFADQFEPDGTGFLYRKSMKGAPVRVSADERDGFVAAFKRRMRYAAGALVLATVALIGVLVALVPDIDDATTGTATGLGIGAVLVPFLAVYFWAWNAPARALARRPALGSARTRAEVRRVMLARMSYGHLGFLAIGAIGAIAGVSRDTDVLHGWGRLWLVLAGFTIAAAGIQAFRKWRLERG